MNSLVTNYYMKVCRKPQNLSVFINIYASSVLLVYLNILPDGFSEFSGFVRMIQIIGFNFTLTLKSF